MPKPLPMSDLEDHLGYQVRRVSNRVSGAFARSLQSKGVSVAEWVALRLIHQQERMASTQLADAAGLTRGATSKVLEKLQSKGLIARSANPQDSRVQWLSLTPKGVRMLPKLAALADQNDDSFFGCLDPEERTLLRRLLDRVVDAHQLRDIPLE